MIWLLLSALCSLAIANIMRYARHCQLPFLPIMTINYFQAALISIVMFVLSDSVEMTRLDMPLGILNSFLYVGGFLLYFEAVKTCGISISVSVMRLSVALPVLAGVFWFNETLNIYRSIGLVLMAIAMFSIGRFSQAKINIKAMRWLILLFVVIGFSSIVGKAYDFYGQTGRQLYLASLFFTAFLLSISLTYYYRMKFSLKIVIVGLILGVPNQATSMFFLMALSTVDSVVAFPTMSISVLSGSMLCDRFIWKEPLGREKVLLIVISMAAIVLLNI